MFVIHSVVLHGITDNNQEKHSPRRLQSKLINIQSFRMANEGPRSRENPILLASWKYCGGGGGCELLKSLNEQPSYRLRKINLKFFLWQNHIYRKKLVLPGWVSLVAQIVKGADLTITGRVTRCIASAFLAHSVVRKKHLDSTPKSKFLKWN